MAIQREEQSASLVCRGIFSLNYRKQHFATSVGFPSLDEARPAYEKLKARWIEDYAGLYQRKEAYTRSQFLDPMLAELQWTFIPEQDLPSKGTTHKRPDYCLFLKDESRQRAAKESETANVFREAATVLEAKKVDTLWTRSPSAKPPACSPASKSRTTCTKRRTTPAPGISTGRF